MNQLMNKLIAIEKDLAEKRGSFWLFAFVLPKSSETGWDLIIAAPWLESGMDGLNWITTLLQNRLTKKEVGQIARVIIFDKFSATVKRVRREMPRKNGIQELVNTDFLGLPVKQAYIIAAGELEQTIAK
jgi:hypothetical protein